MLGIMSTASDERRSEVALARELFDSFMSRNVAQLTYPFMEEVDPDALGLKDYRAIVTEPMWLKRMGEKFDQGIYQNIREFVCDFRLMLLNCYRYNGVTSRIGRMAEKLELLFEQKLQLMPQDIRSKTSIQATLGAGTAEDELSDCGLPRRRSSNRLFVSGDSRQLTPMRAIMEELEHAIQPGSGGVTASLIPGPNDSSGLGSGSASQSMTTVTNTEDRVAILVARLSLWRIRRQEEALLSSWSTWWNEQNGPAGQDIIDHTLELLETYQFLWLADPFLGISDSLTYCNRHTQSDCHVNQPGDQNARNLCLFDLEIALSAAPQASQLLATCMTVLLATPKERGQFVAALSNTGTSNSNDECATDNSGPGGRRSRGESARTLLASVKPLDYGVWERRLASRVESWYRVLWDRGKGSLFSATRRLGLPGHFFRVCGTRSSPLEKRRFHELPVYQRIQIFHALCENTLRVFDNLRHSLDKSADWEATRPVTLGTDLFDNAIYVHFPGMLDSECATRCRVYRLCRIRSDPVSIHEDEFAPLTKQEPAPQSDSPKPYPTESAAALVVSNPANLSQPVPLETSDPATPASADYSEEAASELTESTTTSVPARGRRSGRGKRRRTFSRPAKRGGFSQSGTGRGKPESELEQHNRLVAEWGLPVPGPVGRLPNWLDPSLARTVCRRWFGIVQRMETERAATAAAVATNGEAEKAKPGRKSTAATTRFSDTSLLDELASYPILALGRGRGQGRGRGRGRANSSSASSSLNNTPFLGFAKADDDQMEQILAQEPALRPSPLATLNGLSQRYLSLQLGRGYATSGRGVSKSGLGSRTSSGVDLEHLPTAEMEDENEGQERRSPSSRSCSSQSSSRAPSPTVDSAKEKERQSQQPQELPEEEDTQMSEDVERSFRTLSDNQNGSENLMHRPDSSQDCSQNPVDANVDTPNKEIKSDELITTATEHFQASKSVDPVSSPEGSHKAEPSSSGAQQGFENPEPCQKKDDEIRDESSPCLPRSTGDQPNDPSDVNDPGSRSLPLVNNKHESRNETDQPNADQSGSSTRPSNSEPVKEQKKEEPDTKPMETNDETNQLKTTGSSDSDNKSIQPEQTVENEDSAESLITEPDRKSFVLVTRDKFQLDDLIQRLRSVLRVAEAKLTTLMAPSPVLLSHSSDAQSSDTDILVGSPCSAGTSPSDSDSSLSSLSSRTSISVASDSSCRVKPKRRARSKQVLKVDKLDPRQKRYEVAITAMKQLIANLEALYKANMSMHTECEDARQLARLRLRKDVELWKTAELKRQQEAAKKVVESSSTETSNSIIPQPDLAKERAERLQRREQRRIRDLEDSDSDSQSGSWTVKGSTTSNTEEASGQLPEFSPIRTGSWRSNPKIPIMRLSKDTDRSPQTTALAKTVISELHAVGSGASPTTQGCLSHPTKSPSILPPSIAETTRIRYRLMPPIYTVRPQFPCYSAPGSGPIGGCRSPTSIPNGTPVPRSPTAVPPIRPNKPAVSPSTGNTRKVYRVSDFLFTDDAMPVRLEANGTLHPIPVESVPANLRQMARQMIARYKQQQQQQQQKMQQPQQQQQLPQSQPQQAPTQSEPQTAPTATTGTPQKCVTVTMGQATP